MHESSWIRFNIRQDSREMELRSWALKERQKQAIKQELDILKDRDWMTNRAQMNNKHQHLLP